MCDWKCYLITSLDSNKTYIGASNDEIKRIKNHNCGKGAKYTKGETWIPILYVSGFQNKNECLSFESGWKRLSKGRNNSRLALITLMSDVSLFYSDDPKWNRIMDLIYFAHNLTIIDHHFKLNHAQKYPFHFPELEIEIMIEDWIEELPWPYFIRIN